MTHGHHHAAFLQLRLRAAGVHRFVNHAQSALRGVGHHLPRIGEPNAPPAHHQWLAQLLLHAFDEVAHGGLRQLQRIGRQREAARLRNRRQGAELLQRDFIRRRKSGFHDVAS